MNNDKGNLGRDENGMEITGVIQRSMTRLLEFNKIAELANYEFLEKGV